MIHADVINDPRLFVQGRMVSQGLFNANFFSKIKMNEWLDEIGCITNENHIQS